MSTAQRPLALILARARGGVIGLRGDIPWRRPQDLKHFRRLTLGHAIIMGRKTYASIGRPLPNRRNIVVSRDAGLTLEGCEVCESLEQALALAREQDEEPRVVGGSTLYRQALSLATRIYVTEVDIAVEGDSFFEFDESEWQELERRTEGDLTFRTLARTGTGAETESGTGTGTELEARTAAGPNRTPR